MTTADFYPFKNNFIHLKTATSSNWTRLFALTKNKTNASRFNESGIYLVLRILLFNAHASLKSILKRRRNKNTNTKQILEKKKKSNFCCEHGNGCKCFFFFYFWDYKLWFLSFRCFIGAKRYNQVSFFPYDFQNLSRNLRNFVMG